MRHETSAWFETTIPFWQLSLKSTCAVIGGVMYVPFLPDAAVAPVFILMRLQAVVLVVLHTTAQAFPTFTNDGVCVSVMPGVGQLESAGVTA